jgi:hypothetical protein
MEATHRTRLAKGEVGIRDREPAPTLADFAEKDFLPFVETTSAGKPNTVRFYKNSMNNLKAVPDRQGCVWTLSRPKASRTTWRNGKPVTWKSQPSIGTWPLFAECSILRRSGAR